ncbi:MAG TPA: hypothetical protein VH186_38440 [Chloroflexia bacterium]|nr:hypothetical protein [Chloroflexia bacterium]
MDSICVNDRVVMGERSGGCVATGSASLLGLKLAPVERQSFYIAGPLSMPVLANPVLPGACVLTDSSGVTANGRCQGAYSPTYLFTQIPLELHKVAQSTSGSLLRCQPEAPPDLVNPPRDAKTGLSPGAYPEGTAWINSNPAINSNLKKSTGSK